MQQWSTEFGSRDFHGNHGSNTENAWTFRRSDAHEEAKVDCESECTQSNASFRLQTDVD
jgi:hypothetical protein